jgi:type VI protein secretion system component Hcp
MATNTNTSGDYFMWFPNNKEISGETTDETFEKFHACEVDGFNFKLWNERASTQSGGAADEDQERGKLKFGEVTVKKSVDLASAALYMVCSRGSRLDSITLAARKVGGSRMLHSQYIMRNVLVKEISWEGESERIAETLTLSFKALGFKYNPQEMTGRAAAGGKVWMWDTVSNSSTLGDGGPVKFLNPADM